MAYEHGGGMGRKTNMALDGEKRLRELLAMIVDPPMGFAPDEHANLADNCREEAVQVLVEADRAVDEVWGNFLFAIIESDYRERRSERG